MTTPFCTHDARRAIQRRLMALAASGALAAAPAVGAAAPAAGSAKASGEDASSARSEAARLFRDGVRLYADGHYRSACASFANSIKVLPTKSGLFNLASCRFELGTHETAMAALDQLDAKFGTRLAAAMRLDADSLRTKLEGELNRLSVTVHPAGALVTLNERPLQPNAWVGPGVHRLRVSLEGYQTHAAEVKLTRGGVLDLRVELKPDTGLGQPGPAAEPPPAPKETPDSAPISTERSNTGVWVSGTVSLALVGTSVGLFVHGGTLDRRRARSRAEYDKLDLEERQTPEYLKGKADLDDLRRDSKRLFAASAVTAGAGAIALATTIYFLVSGPDPLRAGGVRVNVGPGNFTLSGRF